MSQLETLFTEINVNIPSLFDPNCYAIHFNGENIFAEKWDGLKDGGNSIVQKTDKEQIRKIATAIKSMEGLVISDEYILIKVVGEYIVRITYPPVAVEIYIDIYKTGPINIPWPSIAEIWKSRKAFVASENKIEYSNGNIPTTLPIELNRKMLFELHRVFKRNAVGWFDGDGIHNDRFKTVEMLTLVNGDRVIIYFESGPVEIQYYPRH